MNTGFLPRFGWAGVRQENRSLEKFGKNMKLSGAILLFSLMTCCAGSPSLEDSLRESMLYRAKLMERLSAVSSKGGISREEAITIGENFAGRYIGCGGFIAISDGGDYWISHNAVGYWGKPDATTRIYKKDGRIASKLLRGKGEIYFYNIWD